MTAEFVLEMAWKSTAVAISVLVLLIAMGRHDPAHRAAVGGLGLALLPLLPLVVLAVAMLPVPSIELPAPSTASPMVSATMDQGAALFPLADRDVAASSEPVVELETLIGGLWVLGGLIVMLRLAAGLLTLRRWTNAAERVSSPAWDQVLRRSGAPDSTALMVSNQVGAPLSWGWRTPVILINRDAFADASGAEAIIAHEAAHLARGDWPRLIAARVAVALFWFNPFVWLLERRHLQDVEEAADAQAAAHIEPTRYAQVLLDVARVRNAPVGANSMARGTLSKRIKQVLSPRVRSPREKMWRSGALAGVAVIAVPVAITQFVAPTVSAAVASTPEVGSKVIRGPVATATAVPTVATAPTVAAVPTIPSAKQIADVVEQAQVVRTILRTVAVVQAAPEPRPIVDQAALAEVLKEAEEARKEAEIVARDAQQIAAEARKEAAQAQAEAAKAMAEARKDMLKGADDMEQGAIDMKEGAADMRAEANRLRDPAYRAEQIRKARARGDSHIPTDQELIDAIPKMLKGADQMDAGVEKMRKGAQKMREQARRS